MIGHLNHESTVVVLIVLILESNQPANLNKTGSERLAHVNQNVTVEDLVDGSSYASPICFASIDQEYTGEIECPALFDLVDFILGVATHGQLL